MTFPELTLVAEQVVAATRRKLPPEIRPLAEKVPVVCHDWPSDEILGGEFEPDILGLFVGDPCGVEPGLSNAAPPHILLFVESIYDWVDGDVDAFREEVRLTYLHELGHYLGWDEDEVEAHGLE